MTTVSTRPTMPGYGIVGEAEGSGLLDWEWAAERLGQSRHYWLSSVRPDGRPHAMPVWGVYLDGQVWFSTGPRSRKATNIAVNPAVVVSTEDAFTPVVVEGDATEVVARDDVAAFAAAMDAKYDSDFGVDFYAANRTFAIAPIRVFGIDGNDFTGSPTRWTLPVA